MHEGALEEVVDRFGGARGEGGVGARHEDQEMSGRALRDRRRGRNDLHGASVQRVG